MALVDFSQTASELEIHIKENPDIKHKVIGAGLEDFFQYIGKEVGITDKWELGGLNVSSMLQPGQTLDSNGDSFTPYPDNGITPQLHLGQLYPAKIDLRFTEIQLKRLVKLFVKTPAGSAMVDSIPREELILRAIFARLNKDLALKTLTKGLAGGSSSDKSLNILNGLMKLIADGIAASSGPKKIPAGNIFTGTAITASNAVAQHRGVYNLIPEDWKIEDWIIFTAPENKEFYDQNYITLYGASTFTPDVLNKGKERLDRTNAIFVPLQGLAGTDKIIVTPAFNIEVGMKNEGDLANIEVQKFNRDLKLMLDFEIGIGIHNYDFLFVNDLT